MWEWIRRNINVDGNWRKDLQTVGKIVHCFVESATRLPSILRLKSGIASWLIVDGLYMYLYTFIYVYIYIYIHMHIHIYWCISISTYCQLALKETSQSGLPPWVTCASSLWPSAQWPRGFGDTPWVRATSGGGMGIVCNVTLLKHPQINHTCSLKRIILYVLTVPEYVESQTWITITQNDAFSPSTTSSRIDEAIPRCLKILGKKWTRLKPRCLSALAEAHHKVNMQGATLSLTSPMDRVGGLCDLLTVKALAPKALQLQGDGRQYGYGSN